MIFQNSWCYSNHILPLQFILKSRFYVIVENLYFHFLCANEGLVSSFEECVVMLSTTTFCVFVVDRQTSIVRQTYKTNCICIEIKELYKAAKLHSLVFCLQINLINLILISTNVIFSLAKRV